MISTINIFDFISNFVLISDFTKQCLNKLCGLQVIDLLYHLPRDYINRKKDLCEAKVGEYVTFVARVCDHQFYKKPYCVTVQSPQGYLTLVFFNFKPQVLKNMLPINTEVVISGKLEMLAGFMRITHPDYMEKKISKMNDIKKITAIYPLNYGISNKNFIRLISDILPRVPNLSEWINPEILSQFGWASWRQSMITIHNPNSLAEAEQARTRLAYDELLSYQIALQLAKKRNAKNQGQSLIIKNNYREHILQKLGFSLTAGQNAVIADITQDQQSMHKMVRLLQGDVGSGKTAVALFAILNAIENSKQAALMAPTEVLSEQHYMWFQKIFTDIHVDVALLIGKIKGKKRKLILEKIANGEFQLVIGTHALFQDQVNFHDLALVVVDEQQRFGVKQRMKLIEKGNKADVLLMTATPIPRTLEQALYGDIDCSNLMEKPKCRLPVITTMMNINRIPEVINRLRIAVQNGEKVYWVCPYIDDCESSNIAAVEKRFDYLQESLKDVNIGIIHGRQNPIDRDNAMLDFRAGKLTVLVATTVIEVGVDVPDATIIIIENAEQFGLSQLHQLRGRVGRSDKQSFCMLLHGNISKIAYHKLKVMKESQDGFYIAEQDLLLRGGGDLVGVKQAGTKDFKCADVFRDQQLINLAHKNAKSILAADPELKTQNIRYLLKLFKHNELGLI